MKTQKFFPVLLAGLALAAPLFSVASQTASPASPQVVEVRVRVSTEGRFVGDLALKDFGVLEDGRLQTASSLALVRGGKLVRWEGEETVPARLERS